MRFRWATFALMVVLLVLSIYGFRFVPKSFFPDSTTPQFTVDYWVRQGTDLTKTSADLAVIEQQIRKLDGVKRVATSVGQGCTRFLLTYSPEGPNTAYGQMIVTVDRFERMAELMPRIEAAIMGRFPGSLAIANPYVLGPGAGRTSRRGCAAPTIGCSGSCRPRCRPSCARIRPRGTCATTGGSR